MEALLAVYILLIVLMIVCLWIMFEKAGEPGWASLIPLYNMMVMCRISGKPEIYCLFMLIPIANLFFVLMLLMDLAKSFGRDAGFGILLFFLPFIGYPMLAFSSDYIGPGGRRRGIRRRARDDDYGSDDDDDRPRRRSRREEIDEDDRPRKRSRRDEDDDEEERPRKRSRRDEDDDEDERPLKRRY